MAVVGSFASAPGSLGEALPPGASGRAASLAEALAGPIVGVAMARERIGDPRPRS